MCTDAVSAVCAVQSHVTGGSLHERSNALRTARLFVVLQRDKQMCCLRTTKAEMAERKDLKFKCYPKQQKTRLERERERETEEKLFRGRLSAPP